MNGRTTGRLIGTTVLIAVTVAIYMAGMWTAWASLYSRLAAPFAVLVMVGAAVAPIQMIRDILHADREDRKKKTENPPEIE